MPDAALPDWPAGTVCVLATSGADGPHAIPVSTAIRAGDDRIVLALARTRGSLERLRADPRVALTVMAGPDLAFTAHGTARVVADPLPGAEGVAGVEIVVDAMRRHERPTFAIDAGRRLALDRRRARRRATASCARRCSPPAPRLTAVKLATFLPPGAAEPLAGEVRGDQVVAFDDGSTVAERLRSGDRTPAAGAAHALADVTLLAPHVPRAIFGIGLNYRAHAAEQGARAARDADRLHEAAVLGRARRAARCRCPAVVRRLDYEGELAVVMGPDGDRRGLRRRRRRQRPRPAAPRAAVDAREGLRRLLPVRPVGDDRRRDRRPGEPRRCAPGSTASCARTRRTSDLVFSIPELIAFIGETITLEPGDLILTGTPSGVGMALDPPRFLEPGDVVRIEIEGLGEIEHGIVDRG